MNAQHTSGPWAYRPHQHDDWGIVRTKGRDDMGFQRVICQANYVASPAELITHRSNNTDPAEANARLIAAAPELLEALEKAVEEIEDLRKYANNHGGMLDDERCDYARAAIAKARGVQP